MEGLQVYGTVRRVGRVTERAGYRERERDRKRGYLQRHLWHWQLLGSQFRPRKTICLLKKLFPFCATRAFSLSIQQHCIFRVKHMRTRYFLLHFPCLFPHFSLRYCFYAGVSSLSLSLLPFLGRLGLQLGPGSPRRGQPDGLMIAKTCLTLAPTEVAVAAANAI